MKNFFLFSAIFLIISTSFSQGKKANFPDDFLGIYKGTLQIHSPRGK